MTEAKSSTEDKEKKGDFLEEVSDLTKILGSLAAACYITGLFVTNRYLQQFDVVEFDVVQARHILTGALFLSWTAITGLLSIPVIQVVSGQDFLLIHPQEFSWIQNLPQGFKDLLKGRPAKPWVIVKNLFNSIKIISLVIILVIVCSTLIFYLNLYNKSFVFLKSIYTSLDYLNEITIFVYVVSFLLFGFIYFACLICVKFVFDLPRISHRKNFWGFFYLIFPFLLAKFWQYSVRSGVQEYLDIFYAFCVTYCISTIVGFGIWASQNEDDAPTKNEKKINGGNSKKPRMIPILVLLFLSSLGAILIANYFAQNYYGNIPESFGGGKPKVVEIIFAKEADNVPEQLTIPLSDKKNDIKISQPVNLVFEGSESYVFSLECSWSSSLRQSKSDLGLGHKFNLNNNLLNNNLVPFKQTVQVDKKSVNGFKELLGGRESDSPGKCADMLDLKQINLSGANLESTDLSKTDLGGANLVKTSFLQANLAGANLRGANLHKADLSWTKLQGAKLQGADLSNAKLQGADLSYTELQGADLSYTELQGAHLTKAKYFDKSASQSSCQRNFMSSKQCPTLFPPGFDPKAAGMELVK